MSVTVGSFTVLPSVSSPSSEISLTVTPPGLVAVACTVLDTPPALTAWLLIAKLAVYVAVSPIARIPAAEPCVAPPKIGPLVKVKPTPLRSVIVSMIETPVKAVSPVLATVII